MESIYNTAQTNKKPKSHKKRSSQHLTLAESRTDEKYFEWHDEEGFPTKKIQLWPHSTLLWVLTLQLRDDASTTTSYQNTFAKDATTSSTTRPTVMSVACYTTSKIKRPCVPIANVAFTNPACVLSKTCSSASIVVLN